MTRPRLLFLGHVLPYPPDRGAALRSYHVLRHLAGRYEIDALLFAHRGDPTQMPLADRIEHLERYARVDSYRVPAEWSRVRSWWDEARSRVRRASVARWRYGVRAYGRRVLELAFERDPRIVHVDSVDLHGFLPLLAGRNVALAHHRMRSDHLRTQSELASGRERSRLRQEADRVEEVERFWLPRVTANVVSSEGDRSRLLERSPESRVEVVPSAVDTSHYTPAEGTGHGLAFVGGATSPASRDALEYFAGEILPILLRKTGVQAVEPLSWIGTAREGDRQRYRERGIDITGYVEDIRPIVRPAACYVVPRRAAGGSTRILQAWAMAKAVVSTSVGCEGLAAVDGENILIRDEPRAFADAVASVLEDRELRRRLGQAARRTAEERYSWSGTGRHLVSLYEELERGPALRSAEGASARPDPRPSSDPTP